MPHSAPKPGAALNTRYRNQARHAEKLVSAMETAVRSGIPADTALHAHFRENRQYGGRDRRVLSALTFAWFRWKGWLATEDTLPDIRALACAAALEGGIPPEMLQALCEAASLPLPPENLDTLALDQKAQAFSSWLNLDKPVQPARLTPPELIALLDPAIPIPAFLVSIQARPPVWLRLRSHEAEANVRGALQGVGLEPIPHPAYPMAWRVQPSSKLQEILKCFPTALQIQSLASQAVGLVCNPKPGDSWWDACCGSGGKTLHLVDQIGPAGKILASDARGSVFDEFTRRLGPDRSLVQTRAHDLTQGTLPGASFAGVLVDAPCSGIGTWARNPDARWRLQSSYIEKQGRKQQTILANAARAVRPGGRLVYSVCTLTSAETTVVADHFTETHAGFEALSFPHPLSGIPCDGRAWIAPHDSMGDGMFIAAWKRIA